MYSYISTKKLLQKLHPKRTMYWNRGQYHVKFIQLVLYYYSNFELIFLYHFEQLIYNKVHPNCCYIFSHHERFATLSYTRHIPSSGGKIETMIYFGILERETMCQYFLYH